ncbi:MAG: hypothetical protein ACLQVM_16385 [Terriglobia bacterium]
MRWRAIILSAAALLTLRPAILRTQTSGPPAEEVAPQTNLNPPDENTPRELVYPYYSLREGTESVLKMMDRAPRTIEYTVAIHSQSGQTATSPLKTIQPTEEVEINVKKLLNDLNVDWRGDFLEGTLSIHFKGKGNPLGGRMLIAGPHESWNIGPVWSSGEFGQNMVPAELDTLWWDLGGTRDVAMRVSNITPRAVVADLYLEFAGKQHKLGPLEFYPYQMKRLSVTELLNGMKLTAYQAPIGGLSIIPRGVTNALIAQGYISDAELGQQAGVLFPLPQLQAASALHATGVPIGPPSSDSPFAGIKDGNFTPHVYLRNQLDSEQTITLTVEFPGDEGPRLIPLPPLKLPGFTTQDIRLDSYYNYLPLPAPYCALRVQYNGPPGSVIGQLTSVNENNARVNPIPLDNEGNGYAGSLASYWGFDDETDFLVFLTNASDEDCRVAFKIEAGGVEYNLTRLKLIPHETKHINLRELRDKQEADFRGKVLPATVTEGRLMYIRGDNVPMIGRVAVVPRLKQGATSH